MATYYVILSDMEGNEDWRYPTEIEATDKKDAYKAIAESCPPENIRAVLTADEYRAKTSNKNFQRQQRINGLIKADNSEMSGKDFMDTMLQAAMASGELEEETEVSNQPISQEITQPAVIEKPIPVQTQATSEIKYFTDNGVMFKVENNIIYKKCWETVDISESTDPETGNTISPEFRIINIETGKPFKSEKYAIQRLIWKPLNIS